VKDINVREKDRLLKEQDSQTKEQAFQKVFTRYIISKKYPNHIYNETFFL